MFQNHLQFVQLCDIIDTIVYRIADKSVDFSKIHKFVTFRPHFPFIINL